MRLNLSMLVSLSGLAVAAVVLGAYHVFVEPLFPASGWDLFWMLYIAAGFNMYGYFFRFSSLFRPSVYRQRYREMEEMASWTRKKIPRAVGVLQTYGRRLVKEYPLVVALWIAYGLGLVAKPLVGWWSYAPMWILIALIFYQTWQETSKRQDQTASTEAN